MNFLLLAKQQTSIDKGIRYNRQIYSKYKGKFCKFQDDNAGGFHGYPIPKKDVPSKALAQLE